VRNFLSFVGGKMGSRYAEEDIEIKREEVTGEWRRLLNEKLHDCTFQHVGLVFRHPNEDQLAEHAG
jgi:hypothetical protein